MFQGDACWRHRRLYFVQNWWNFAGEKEYVLCKYMTWSCDKCVFVERTIL